MSQPLHGVRPHRLCIAVHHPVDAAVTDRVHTHMHAGIVKQPNEMTDSVGIRSRVSAIARIDARVVLVPVVVQPRGAGSAAPVDIELDAPRHEAIVTRAHVRSRHRRPLRNQLLRRGFGAPAKPQRKHPHCKRSLSQHLRVGRPRRGSHRGILDRRHALRIEPLRQVAHSRLHLRRRA